MQTVYRQGQRFVPDAFARQEPAAVPEVLKAWLEALKGLDQAHHIQRALLQLVNMRSVQTADKQVMPCQSLTFSLCALPLDLRVCKGQLKALHLQCALLQPLNMCMGVQLTNR